MKNIMKKSLKILFISFALIILLVNAVIAASVLTNEEVKAVLSHEISVIFQGEELNLKDSKPIIYNNTTYVPIRVISEALGVAVNWEPTTKQILLGEQNKKILISSDNFSQKYKEFTYSINKEKLLINGVQYNYGIITQNQSWKAGPFTLKTDKSTSKFGGVFFVPAESRTEHPVTVKILNDKNEELAEFEITKETPVQFEIETGSPVNITFDNYGSTAMSHLYLLEPYFIY